MAQYWFEIFRQTYDRWSWHFVEIRDGQRRVLARSGRDYRSRRRARKAVRALKGAVRGAQIVVPGGGHEGFPLPASNFAVDYDVVPLMVGASRGGYGPRRRRRDRRDRTDEPDQAREATATAAAQEAAAAAASEPEQAAQAVQQTKPRSGRGRRSPKST
jgi:hypothetical protein